ncbi:hypothetical protein BBP40_004043 [Aspergillus hancockii]|nr:hypothetical protein BBP40_004043 [Aspergillus hancockii]
MAYLTNRRTRKGIKPSDSTDTPASLPSRVEIDPEGHSRAHWRDAQKSINHIVSVAGKRTPSGTLRLRQPNMLPDYQGPVALEPAWWTVQRFDPEARRREEAKSKEQIRQAWLKRLRPRPSPTSPK